MKLTFQLLLFCLFFSMSNAQDSTSQTVGNFSLDRDGKIVWRNYFHIDSAREKYLEKIKAKNMLLNLSMDSFSIKGDLNGTDPDFTGFKPSIRPMILWQSKILARVIVKLEGDEYYITISNIFYKQLFDSRLRRKGSMTNLESIEIKHGRFTKEFKSITSKIVNNTFEKLFSGL